MPSPIQKVKPGDLITSEFMNKLLDQVNNLEERLARIEAEGTTAGAVVILDILPEGTIRVGDELRLIGRNFGVPAQNVVTLSGTRIDQFKAGSGDSQLVFDVPPIPGLTEQAKTVALTLSNPKGFVSQAILLADRPVTVPEGEILVSLTKAPEGELKPDGKVQAFVFTLKAFTNMDETFVLTPSLDVGWPLSVVATTGGSPAPTAELLIPKGTFPQGTERTVTVNVTVPTTVAAGTKARLRLTATSKRNPQGLTNSSGSLTLTVGQPPPPASAFPVTIAAVRSPGTQQGEFVAIPVNASAIVQFQAELPPGDYAIKLSIPNNPNSLWTIESRMTPPDSVTVQQRGLIPLITRLTSKAGAQPTDLVVRVEAKDNSAVFGELTQRIKLT